MGKDVIIALDFDSREKTLAFLDLFQDEKPFVKIGMELFYAEGPDIVRQIHARGHRIFLDLKLHDIPNTVKKAMAALSALDVDIINLHAAGTKAMMSAALEGLTRPDGTRPLLIAVPFQPGNGTGFDTYAAGRAIAIRRDAHKPAGFAHLHGLDEERKTITISDDEFGSWFSHIDHNPQRYIGYRVRLTGFVYKPSTLGAHEFELSRQFMSCCILDMTPFGFTTHYAKTAKSRKHLLQIR